VVKVVEIVEIEVKVVKMVVLLVILGVWEAVMRPVVQKLAIITTNTHINTPTISTTYSNSTTSKTNSPTNCTTTSHLSTIYTTTEAERALGSNWFGFFIATTKSTPIFYKGGYKRRSYLYCT
jgi:hypothetical protein